MDAQIPIAAIVNVALSALAASVFGGVLIALFVWLGESVRVRTGAVSSFTVMFERQFGAVGFYFLVLTGLEVLNPTSLSAATRLTSVTYKPGLLGHTVLGLMSVQDVVGIFSLLILVGSVWAATWRAGTGQPPVKVQRRNHGVAEPTDDEFATRTADLRFAFQFSAVSLLIGLIAPDLAARPYEQLGSILLIGLLLVSGSFCFCEGLKIGLWIAEEPAIRSAVRRRVVLHVLGPSILAYLVVATGGFTFYAVIPEWLGSGQADSRDLPELVRVTTKFIAGVFIMMAGYLVAFGRAGFASRLTLFMVTASIAPLLAPTSRILGMVALVYGLPSQDVSLTVHVFLLLAFPAVTYLVASGQPLGRVT